MATASMHPEMPGQRREAGRTVSVTATTFPVRGFSTPSVAYAPPESGAHGRIADDGGPQSRLEARMRWSAAGDACLACGREIAPGDLRVPSNARVESFIPFDALFPLVDVVVTNGG